jgi:AhpD family alkylhydroperoxidase
MNTAEIERTEIQSRLTQRENAAPVWQALLGLQQAANRTKLEPKLLELVKTRASQINRCGFCLDMHIKEAQSRGELPERLYLLNAWEEVNVYSERERAALLWTETLTRLPEGVSDEVFAEVSAQFSEVELAELTLAIIAINSWNRLNVGFRVQPGTR